MKILFVNYEFPTTDPNCGGGGVITEQLAAGFWERLHGTRIVTDNAGTIDEPNVFGPDTGGHWSTFPLRSYKHLKRQVEEADVVNGHFSLPSSVGLPRLCDAADTPLVVSVMGADVYDPTRFRLVRPVADRLNQYILDRADAVIAPSADMADRVHRKYGVDCRVIQYGIDPSDWVWRDRDVHSPLRVLTVCRAVDRKNLDTAVISVSQLNQMGIDAEYRIVGEGPALDAISHGGVLFDWLDLRGYVDDLQAEMDWADVFFLPSKHEAFGVVFLEALASGLPVVTSNSGGQTDIVGPDVGFAGPSLTDGGVDGERILAVDTYPEQLAEVAANYDEYQRATRGYVEERFSRERMVDEYEQLFQELTA